MKVQRKIIATWSWIIACLFAGVLATAINAQDQTVTELLQINQTLTRELKGGLSHTYQLRLDARTFTRVQVIQRGVDVIMIALDGQKNRLALNDDSFGRVGPQFLEFVTEAPGDYFIQVTARKDEQGGKYDITCVESRTATEIDRTRVIAAAHLTAANELRLKATAESRRQAILRSETALALYRALKDAAGQALSLQNVGRNYEGLGDYRKALENYSSALAWWRDAKERRGEAFNLHRIGEMHFYLGNLDISLASYQQAVEICREVGDEEGEGLNYNFMANVHNRKGEIDRALEYFQKALRIYDHVGTKQGKGVLLGNMGVAYRDLGDLQRATDYQNQALAIWRALKDKHGVALALTNLGIVFAQHGETRKALSLHQEALPLCLELGDQNCEARAYWQLASVYASLGETQTALNYYEKSAAIYRRQVGRTVAQVRMLNSAGTLFWSLGQKRRALEFHNEALDLARKSDSRGDEATTLSHLAEVYKDEGETPKAKDLYRQALVICREIKNRLCEATNLNRLGLIAQGAGNNEEAITLFEQALATSAAMGTKYLRALALNNLGTVHQSAGKPKIALEYFTEARALFREIENKSGEATMNYRLASVQTTLGQMGEARRNISAALEIVETIRGKIANPDFRSSYFSTVQQYYDLYIDLLMREHRTRPDDDLDLTALQVSEQARARSLLDLLKEAKTDARQGVEAKLLAREKELVELINGKAAQQQQAFIDPRKAELAQSLGAEITRLSDEYENLQANIRQSNPRYAELIHAGRLSREDLHKLLDPETVLLEFKLGEEQSYLWLVTQNTVESFELASRGEIEPLAKQAYELLTERNRSLTRETRAQKLSRIQTTDQRLLGVAARLRQLLFEPVSSAITGKRLVIVAEGALQYLPFSLLANAGELPSNGLKQPLAANEVVLLPSIGVLAQLRRENAGRRPPGNSVAVFADPVFESDDPRLPAEVRTTSPGSNAALIDSQSDFDFGPAGARLPRLFASREEAQAILALAPPGSTYSALDFNASRERALSRQLSQYRVLHFATHGLLNTARPELSGIVLSLYDEKAQPRDGFLRLNQIYNMQLSSDLVVLSACRTALGKDVKGEGLIGLTRGFMFAGVPRVIASLWKVDDEATAELMKYFYRNLLRENMSPSKALNAAQIEMQKQERWRAPYYWAAFTLQGDWR